MSGLRIDHRYILLTEGSELKGFVGSVSAPSPEQALRQLLAGGLSTHGCMLLRVEVGGGKEMRDMVSAIHAQRIDG